MMDSSVELALTTIDLSEIDTIVQPSIASPVFMALYCRFPGLPGPTIAIMSFPSETVPNRTGFGPGGAAAAAGGGAFGSSIAMSVRSKLNGLCDGMSVQFVGAGEFGGTPAGSFAKTS